jgi:hypothetical protein
MPSVARADMHYDTPVNNNNNNNLPTREELSVPRDWSRIYSSRPHGNELEFVRLTLFFNCLIV